MSAYDEPSWGVKLNRQDYGNLAIPAEWLTWATRSDKENYQKRGLVVWSLDAQRVERLSPALSLQYLEQMRAADTWQTEGVPIVQQYTRLLLPDSPKKKGRRKKEESTPEVEAQESKPELVVEERFRLNPEQSAQFLQALEAGESDLRAMAAEDEKKQSEALTKVYSILLEGVRTKEGDKIDFSTHPFTWEKMDQPLTWICDRPPNRGSITPTEDYFFWRGYIEQPDRFKRTSPVFVELEAALSWVEKELAAIEQEPSEPVEPDRWPRIPLTELVAQKRTELADYWIEPAALEPEQITYQVVIDLECVPKDYKTMEMSFGKKLYYDEKYASPIQLAKELRLDPQLDIHEMISGWYRLVSRVTYFREDVALTQAQRFWDQSAIVQQHRAGKVLRAQYTYQEVETGYRVILGACENPEQPYPPQKNRETYLISQALEETLAYALDVAGYRSFSGLGPETLSDAWVLEKMHTRRAKSRHVPMEAQLESERWLRVNKSQ